MALVDYKDGIVATPVGASGPIGPFSLLGGKYALSVVGSGTIATQLEALGADGSTYVAIGSAIAANGVTVFDLAPGKYEVTTGASSSANAVSLIRIPTRNA